VEDVRVKFRVASNIERKEQIQEAWFMNLNHLSCGFHDINATLWRFEVSCSDLDEAEPTSHVHHVGQHIAAGLPFKVRLCILHHYHQITSPIDEKTRLIQA
jgi:hypothetical protein